MARWQPDARERLEHAALELFAEQGFAETTVPQITARAGLTTRTFFRHFADKREVLFTGEEEVLLLVARLMAEAPAHLGPVPLIVFGLDALAAHFEGRHATLRARAAVVQSDAGLRERDLSKMGDLSDAITAGFRARGVDPLTSVLAARTAVTIVNVSIGRWLDEEAERPLIEIFHDTAGALQTLVSELGRPRSSPPGGRTSS